MKLMNEIESDVAGEIVKKLVSNGQPIEYGQELFAIRPKELKLDLNLLSQAAPERACDSSGYQSRLPNAGASELTHV